MTAGSIAVPTVMPLRLPKAGVPKNHIDSNTLIEIHSESPNTKIYYTVNNTRPEPCKKLGENTTLLYKEPFMLHHGKRCIKAMAQSRDGRESNVVTKVFNVEYAEQLSASSSESEEVDNASNFQNQLQKQSSVESKIRTASALSEGRFGTETEAWGDISASPSLQDLSHRASYEHRFPLPAYSGSNAPPLPRLDGELIRCPLCLRVNNPDARYCDWCGDKPIPNQSPITCSLREYNNPPYSNLYSQDGSKFIAPDRMDPRNANLGTQNGAFPLQSLPMWKSVPLPTLPRSGASTHVVRAPKPRCNEVQTQTVGLFYPGGKKIYQEQEMMEEIRRQELKMRDRQPPLTSISPGKGYWRKQLDHICGHLRAYTNNNVEFRSVVSEPRLGKILTTAVDEGEEVMTISMTFALKGHTEYGDGGITGLQRDIYMSKKKIAFGRTFDEEELEKEKTKKGKKKRKKKAIKIEKLNPEDRLLLRELGPRGDGRTSEIKQLLKEGADPNCLDSDRRSVLSVAVMRNNIECVRELVKGGADVNRRSGSHHDTPLHYAVKLGPDGKDMVKTLLDLGAHSDIRNEVGLSAYDAAVRADYNSILALFNEPKTKPIPRPKSAKVVKKVTKVPSSDDDDDTEEGSSDF